MSVLDRITIISAEKSTTSALIVNALLLTVWIWLYRPIAPYLHMVLTRQDFRTNQIAFAILLALFVYKAREGQIRVDFGRKPQLRPLPLILALTSSILFVYLERMLDINNISAGLLVFATWSFSGLWLNPTTWKRSIPVMLLLAGTLPINQHLQTFVGYPMRLVSAAMVRDVFAAAGVASLGVSTILVFENGVANIDLPCSGVQSLWTGAMFLTTATWLEQKRLGLRWLITAALLGILLFGANLVRIAALVWSGQVLELPLLAEMLHVPLGVLGFVLACVAALALLRGWVPDLEKSPLLTSPRGRGIRHASQREDVPVQSTKTALAVHTTTNSSSPAPLSQFGRGVGGEGSFASKFPIALLLTLILLSLFHKPYVRANTILQAETWQFAGQLQTEPLPLEQAQTDWLLNDGADAADRFRFKHAGLSGSMLFVVASNWHAHHFPEGCFTGLGLTTQESRTELIAADFPVRWITMHAPDGTPYSAVYWFQSTEKITDDYATRIWDDLRFDRNEWVLVSTLFDGQVDPTSAETHNYLTDLRQTVTDKQ